MAGNRAVHRRARDEAAVERNLLAAAVEERRAECARLAKVVEVGASDKIAADELRRRNGRHHRCEGRPALVVDRQVDRHVPVLDLVVRIGGGQAVHLDLAASADHLGAFGKRRLRRRLGLGGHAGTAAAATKAKRVFMSSSPWKSGQEATRVFSTTRYRGVTGRVTWRGAQKRERPQPFGPGANSGDVAVVLIRWPAWR
jgi:phage terminase large subunit-like protein